MSKFRPTAVVTSPDGAEWEIYAYRFRWTPPSRRREILRAALAAARTLVREDWTVDAITYLPRETVYTWTTTGEHKGQVLAQVEGHLARGDIPMRLANATYLGELRRSAR
jgi:hypothetical protein